MDNCLYLYGFMMLLVVVYEALLVSRGNSKSLLDTLWIDHIVTKLILNRRQTTLTQVAKKPLYPPIAYNVLYK